MLKTVMIAKLMPPPEKDPDLFRMLLWGEKNSIGNGLKFSLIVHHWTGEIEYTAQRQAAHVILICK